MPVDSIDSDSRELLPTESTQKIKNQKNLPVYPVPGVETLDDQITKGSSS